MILFSIDQRSAPSRFLQKIALGADPLIMGLRPRGLWPLFVTLRDMTIAAITKRHTREELAAIFPAPDIHWICFRTLYESAKRGEMPDGSHTSDEKVDVWLDLDFVCEEARIEQLSRWLPALVIVNAVTPTLREIGRPFVRLNAWPGFAERSIHELVVPDEVTAHRVEALYHLLGHAYRIVPDEPGMISARIVATIINEAFFTWEEKVGTKEDIDVAMRLGTNYPHGPFEWSDRIGPDCVLALLSALSKSDSRYEPSAALVEDAALMKQAGAGVDGGGRPGFKGLKSD
jgi:3-hydroxybutyryl-CoA dehydrogenase